MSTNSDSVFSKEEIDDILFKWFSIPDRERRRATVRLLNRGLLVLGPKLELIPNPDIKIGDKA